MASVNPHLKRVGIKLKQTLKLTKIVLSKHQPRLSGLILEATVLNLCVCGGALTSIAYYVQE